jgi:hypothetical protein
MNRDELKAQLASSGVPADSYSLAGGLPNEAFCLDQDENGTWRTYYSERGERSSIKTYATESEACAALLSLIQNR